ncbi:hypothetical protein LguiB_005454 [Lonicera macranthoides]
MDQVIIERASSFLLRQHLDLHNEGVKMKDAIFKEGFKEVPPPVTGEARPWNLRTMRAACKEPRENNNGFSLTAEQVPCATTFSMVSSPGSSWATNGHYPARVSPGVVLSRVSMWFV